MNSNDVKNGLRVKTTKLGETKGMIIAPRHLTARREGVIGTLTGYVPGHGGDVWWLKHEDDGEVGAYCFDEFEPAP